MFFGGHVSASGGIDKAAERAAEMGAEAVQVFTQSPRVWRPTNHKPSNVERWFAIREEHGIRAAVAHAIYLINLASDTDVYDKSVEALSNTVRAGELLGLDGVIFHVGSHKQAGLDSCIDKVARGIAAALDHAEDTWLLIENSAGQGGTIGRSVEELARLVEKLDRHPRLGVCIDTCHWWVSGVDVTDGAVLDAALGELDDAVGIERLRALHINDAKTELGSNRDRHANIGEGTMGAGLATFLRHPKLQGLPALLEVPGEGDGPTAGELAKVRALHAGP